MISLERHYAECYKDYKRAWRADRTRSLHFGYYQTGKEGHEEAIYKMIHVLAKLAGIRKDDLVLDAGCGWGGSSARLVKNIGCKACAVDVLDGQLVQAKETLGTAAYIARMDFCQLALRDESVSVVWAIESVCHAKSKGAFLREASRVLKPGGRIAIADGFCPSGTSDALADWGVAEMVSPTLFRSDMLAAGFTDIQVADVTKNILPSFEHLHRLATSLWMIGVVMRFLRLRSEAQMANLRMARRAVHLWKSAGYKYLLITASAGFKPLDVPDHIRERLLA